jgi:hypothetical protein
VTLVGEAGNKTPQPNRANVFQLFAPNTNEKSEAMLCRCRLLGNIVPVRDIAQNAAGVITKAAEQAAFPAPGMAFIVTERLVESTPLWAELAGEFVVDAANGRAVDGAFVRGKLPTGNRSNTQSPPASADSLLGIEGTRFYSWFTYSGTINS